MSEMAREKFDQTCSFDQYLSFLDMEKHPLWDEAWKGQNAEKFDQILYDMGADLSKGWEITMCLHRARTSNNVEYGPRVSFVERQDKWWVSNMMATSDIVRNTHDSIRATGMRQAINEDSPLHEVMMDQAAKYAVVVDIKCSDLKEEIE